MAKPKLIKVLAGSREGAKILRNAELIRHCMMENNIKPSDGINAILSLMMSQFNDDVSEKFYTVIYDFMEKYDAESPS